MKNKLLEQDKFGQAFNLNISDGIVALPSLMGTFCTLLNLVILVSYATYKVDVLGSRKSVDIISAV